MGTLRIPVFSRKHPGLVAIIDEADAELVRRYHWHLSERNGSQYARAYIRGANKNVLMHRLILGVAPGIQVDHRDGDGLNNQRANLREADHQTNAQNRKKPATNTSGYKGVSYVGPKHGTNGKRWMARVKVGGKSAYCEMFATPGEAARAYDRMAREIYGEYARTNFDEAA